MSVNEGYPYLPYFETPENVYLFETDKNVTDYVQQFNLYDMEQYKIQNDLNETLTAINNCGLLIKRPFLPNSEDYRDFPISTDTSNFTFEG